MATITPTTIFTAGSTTAKAGTQTASMAARFINWCESQEQNRFGWLAAVIAIHGCAFTPLTLFAIVLSGNSIFFWVVALAGMGASLVTNLAAQPTKVTLPVFFATLLIDLVIVATCMAQGFDIAGTYI